MDRIPDRMEFLIVLVQALRLASFYEIQLTLSASGVQFDYDQKTGKCSHWYQQGNVCSAQELGKLWCIPTHAHSHEPKTIQEACLQVNFQHLDERLYLKRKEKLR